MIRHDLSFHFDQPTFAFAGLEFAFQVYSVDNVYGLAAEATTVRPGQDGLAVDCNRLTWAGGQERAEGRLSAMLCQAGDDLTVEITADHAERIKAVKTLIYGLTPGGVSHLGEIINEGAPPRLGDLLPGGDLLVAESGWSFTPSEVAFLHHGARCDAFASRDEAARPKRFYFSNRTGRFIAELVFEEEATRWATHVEIPPWRIQLETTPAEAIQDYAQWLEGLDGLLPWERRPDVPDWARDIRLVVNLHGEHWTGYIFNTFDQMLDALRALNRWIPARHLLAYVPGYSGRYYHSYPYYQPGPRLGGEAGFRRLVKGARALGCRVMPMLGAHGCNIAQFPEWQKAVVQGRYGRIAQVLNMPDWDGDRAGEGQMVMLNLGETGYRQHLVEETAGILNRFGLEAAFFDTLAWTPADARHSMWEGCRALMTELRGRFPHVLWTSEGAHARLLQFFPFVQTRLKLGERPRYPEFAYRYVRTFDHLDTGAPGLGSSGVHERGFHRFHEPEYRPSHLPALSIVDDTLSHHDEAARRVCELALEYGERQAK